MFTNFFKILWGAYELSFSVSFQPFQLIILALFFKCQKRDIFLKRIFNLFYEMLKLTTRCILVYETHDTFFLLLCRILRCGRHRPIRLPGPPGRPWWAPASRPWGRATGRAALGGPQCGCPWWGRAESPLMGIQVRTAGFCIFVKYL